MLTSFRHTFNWSALEKNERSIYFGKSSTVFIAGYLSPLFLSTDFWNVKGLFILILEILPFSQNNDTLSTGGTVFQNLLYYSVFWGHVNWHGIWLSESVLRIAKFIYSSIYLKVFHQDSIHNLPFRNTTLCMGMR